MFSIYQKKILISIIPLVLIALGFLYFNMNPADKTNGFVFPSCPTYTFLGVHCPGCGTQRALHYLLHLELYKAFRYNPLMVVLLPLAIILVIQKIYIFLEKPIEIPLFRKPWFTISLFFVVVIYFILRNIPLPVFDNLRPPLEML